MDFNETCIILHGIIRSISSAKENPGVDFPFKEVPYFSSKDNSTFLKVHLYESSKIGETEWRKFEIYRSNNKRDMIV